MVRSPRPGSSRAGPIGRSAAATQMRWSPWRRYSWALSPVWSRRAPSTGPAAASRRSSPAAEASSARRGPRTKRPCMSRATRRWCSSATASRWAVGRASPVAADELGEGGRAGLQGAQHDGGLVQHADSARVVHAPILPSHCLRRKFAGAPRVRGPRDRMNAGRHDAVTEGQDGRHAGGEGLGRARRAPGRGRARPALHRPPPPARGDQPAGLRRPAAGRPHGAPARPDHRDRGPQRPDDARARSPTRSAGPRWRRCAATARSSACGCTRMGDVDQGIVHVVGPQLGLTQPGMTVVCGDSPHLHPRRVRRAGVRHRHQRGRARAGHPDAAAEPFQDHGDHGRRRAARRRHRQGPDPGHHRQDRHRRRPGLRPRVPRLRHRGALDGGPDDHLQHVDRGRRPRRDDRPRRDHLRLPQGPPARPQGADWDAAVAYWETLRTRRRRRLRRRGAHRRRRR